MSRIEELLNKLCPDGVECRPLGSVGAVVRGKRFVKTDMIDAGVPCIHYGEIYTRYGISAVESYSFVSKERARTLRFAQPGDVIMASAGETVEDIGKSVAWLGKEPIAIHDACYSFSSPLDPTFVSYFFASRSFRDQIRQQISSSKISSISTQNVAKARIPVPPIEVQRKIAAILDNFSNLETSLESELGAELRERQIQYVYYRDSLLAFSGGSRRFQLGDLGSIFGGLTGKSKADFLNGNARYVSYKNVYNNIAVNTAAHDYVQVAPNEKQRSLRHGDVIFTGSSETADEVGMSSVVTAHVDEPLYLNSFCIGFRPTDVSMLDPEFAKHLFRSGEMRRQIVRTASGVTRFNVSKIRLAAVEVPVPPIAEQRRLAAVLDEFESLVKDLSVGLPAELAARRKQYEHYRDKLVTFSEFSS